MLASVLLWRRRDGNSAAGCCAARGSASACAAAKKFFQTIDFVVGQTGQRRAFAGDPRFRADLHQLFAVDLQFFRQRENAYGQVQPSLTLSQPRLARGLWLSVLNHSAVSPTDERAMNYEHRAVNHLSKFTAH
jgi:hypothetical protein